MEMPSRTAIIIGAGPAGLTAAYELLARTSIRPVIVEKSQDIGGISRTVNYKGNRMDIGGHRFFSKSDRVMNWWLNMMPLADAQGSSTTLAYQNSRKTFDFSGGKAKGDNGLVMLLRQRLSRIYFLGRFFDYPLSLSLDTVRKLGFYNMFSIGFSYCKSVLFPIRQERSLEDFFINRFGGKLYSLFFRDYTEKVWGRKCSEIPAEWGRQRIKGLDIKKAISHAIMGLSGKSGDIAQKGTETSLIDQFLYPRLGPGQLWEEVARRVVEMGGEIHKGYQVTEVELSGNKVSSLKAVKGGDFLHLSGDYFFSTMPVKDLVEAMGDAVPAGVKAVARGLEYRDFITVGVLLKRMSVLNGRHRWEEIKLADNWIYVQDKAVKVGRLQIFNNWSPDLVADKDTVWVGMEFFCNECDPFWKLSDIEITGIAIAELEKINLACARDVMDHHVVRVEKTYPAYFGSYDRFGEIRAFTDGLENLFMVGRNGMHRYNNADHSMLTAMTAVDNIISGELAKENIWEINTEQEYHERVTVAPETKGEVSRMDALPALGNGGETEREESFMTYMKRKENRNLFAAVLGICAVMWGVFKWYYPQASFINGDSYAYLTSAFYNLYAHTYPVGYPKFLRFFSVFSNSDYLLTTFQYLLLQFSLSLITFAFSYLIKLGDFAKYILIVVLMSNPVNLYLSNYISSDSIFYSLSILWFTSLLLLVFRPSKRIGFAHAILIFACFTVRNNALFYPIVSILAIPVRWKDLKLKTSSVAIAFAMISVFVSFTATEYRKLSGQVQFSPFSGWQLANNALYAYRFIDSSERLTVPEKYQRLDETVRKYFDSTRNWKKHPYERILAGTMYMWDRRSPLRIYMRDSVGPKNALGEVANWAALGPLYKGYGKELIFNYPKEFARYYLWPNAKKYFAPSLEFLGEYSTGRDTVAGIAKYWFGWKDNKLRTRTATYSAGFLNYMPPFSGAVNALFIFLSVVMFLYKKKDPMLECLHRLFLIFFVLNFTFSVFAAPVSLRFQLFQLSLSFSGIVIIINYLVKRELSLDALKIQKVQLTV